MHQIKKKTLLIIKNWWQQYKICTCIMKETDIITLDDLREFMIEYNGREITVREDGDNWYVNFNTGLGEGIYPKKDWTLQKAINDQANIYKEN